MKRMLTVILAALLLVLVAAPNVAQGADFKPGSYSGPRVRGDKVTLKFEDKGKFVLADKDRKVLVEGTYKLKNDEIEFTDEKGPMAAKDAKPGKYKWKLEEKQLSFTKVEDESEGRSNGLTRTTWTFEP